MENKMFELLEKMYVEFSEFRKETNSKFENLDSKFGNLEKRQQKLEMLIENDIKPRIETLFDGYKQNTEQLSRIENEVSKHEEIIFKRVK